MMVWMETNFRQFMRRWSEGEKDKRRGRGGRREERGLKERREGEEERKKRGKERGRAGAFFLAWFYLSSKHLILTEALDTLSHLQMVALSPQPTCGPIWVPATQKAGSQHIYLGNYWGLGLHTQSPSLVQALPLGCEWWSSSLKLLSQQVLAYPGETW